MLEKAQEALRHATFLSFELEVTAPPSVKVRAVAKMAPGKLLSRFYVKDASSEEFKDEKYVGELVITGGRVREIRFDCMGVDRIEARYKAPNPGGTYQWFLDKGIEKYPCLVASALKSWVGAESVIVQSRLPLFILEGELQNNKIEDGKLCYVIRWERAAIERIDDFYFDSTTYFLVRWDIFYTDLGSKPMLSRTRRFKNMSTAPLPADTWKVPFERPVHSDKLEAGVDSGTGPGVHPLDRRSPPHSLFGMIS